MTVKTTLALAAVTAALLAGCPADPEPTIPDDIFGDLGDVAPWATDQQVAAFERGRAVALRRFTIDEGLGPHFNLSFCGGCHERPTTGGGAPRYRDFYIVAEDIPGGPQNPLGVSGVQPQFDVTDSRYPTPDGVTISARRNPIPFFGAGLMAEIPGEVILGNADPDDADGDGISGRANFDQGFVGRFGRKSQTVSVEGFIRGPLFNHVGITSDPLPQDQKALLPVPSANGGIGGSRGALTGDVGVVRHAQASAPESPLTDDDDVPDPELSADDLFDLVSFAMLLAAPAPDEPTPETEAGQARFEEIGCIDCHRHTLRSARGLIPLYSDLLLHDMGEEMADGLRMGVSDGNEYRTQPLWGVSAVGPFLHDGRADTLDEAIRWHGGEGQASKEAYEALDDAGRSEVLAFLESLGGASQVSQGLIPPGEAAPADGELGGAIAGTDPGAFEVGRRIFDGDFGRADGLGPNFNGDSCRACHFEPVVGGAGPIDVNVTRQAIDGTGGPAAPPSGTMAHRFGPDAVRPDIDPASDFFELRQTPPVFGLGLVDQIPEATIMAGADPDDLDMDGISGRAHVLGDGRLGRLGWKAQVPNLAEFARDAMSAEVGTTVPAQPGLTFGAMTDDDDVPDPEITATELEALVFYMATLAAPPRVRSDPALEDMGETLFADVGCDACHLSLALADGTEVVLYSDLLLHDVFPMDGAGIPDGDAAGRELRTPPLWGVGRTGPWMHDGRSGTLDDAVARHFAEGSASAEAYAALNADERAAVIAFLTSL